MQHLEAVFAVLGEPRTAHSAPVEAWERLETGLGVAVPDDYKKIVEAYAPVQVNRHLYLLHPSEDLGLWMEQTVQVFRNTSWDEDVACPGFEETGPLFGGRTGMVPLATTDRGEYVFAARDERTGGWRVLTCDGDEQAFSAYRMGFAEWLHGYLAGGDMVGPGSSVFCPGPIRLERSPVAAGGSPVVWEGPER
ncbi:SMI1/KNR4 family protein [Streptomyces sp. R44]|uniref:SMI1/KNR4 family protein n=1 Tax=Streptomyces sp. R44 TaxID=3238633 RepID=A0AB39T3Q3_9ACTN